MSRVFLSVIDKISIDKKNKLSQFGIEKKGGKNVDKSKFNKLLQVTNTWRDS